MPGKISLSSGDYGAIAPATALFCWSWIVVIFGERREKADGKMDLMEKWVTV